MRPAETQPEEAVRMVPLDRLEISPANVRKTDAGLQSFAELKASLADLGILSNLVVRPVEGSDDRFAVVAGGRRYNALVELAAEGQVAPDYAVPCRVVPTDASETEISLAENVIRAPMHPADQVEAFAALAAAGSTVSGIAARFGVAERTVEQRLRLGNAAPELLQAYRDEAIDLECLKAFAVTADPVRQLAAWKQVSGQGYRPTAWQIKRILTDDRIPAGAAIAAFVGVEAYEAAGGIVDRDLFADEREFGVWFEDAQLLDRLATERLQEIADKVAAEWKWAEPRVEVEWNEFAPFGRVHAVPGEPTPEEAAERDRLHTRHDELVNLHEDDWTDDLVSEGERIGERLRELQAAVDSRARFADEDKAIAGCIVTIDPDGEVETIEGLVRPEDIPAPADNGSTEVPAATAAANGAASGGPAARASMTMPSRPLDPAAEARKRAGIGIAHADDLRSIRTAGIKVGLANDFEAAFDLFLFQAAISVFTQGYVPTSLEIAARETPDRPHVRNNDEGFAAESPFEADLADWSDLPLEWMEHEDEARAFEVFRALSAERKRALFAAAIARTVKGQLSFEHDARPALEATVARLGIDFAARLRPSAAMFWSRITKGRMLDIARDVFGAEWAAGHAQEKKAVLAATMERAFGVGDDVPPGITQDTRAAALAWVPPGFAPFDGQDDDFDPSAELVAGSATPDTAAESDSATTDAGTAHFVVDGAEAETAPDDGDATGLPDPVPAAATGQDIGGEGLDIPDFLRRA